MYFYNFASTLFSKKSFPPGDASTKNVNFDSTLFPQNSFSPTLRSGENVNIIEKEINYEKNVKNVNVFGEGIAGTKNKFFEMQYLKDSTEKIVKKYPFTIDCKEKRKIVVFDLDETIGSFSDFIHLLKYIKKRNNIKITQILFNKLLDLYPEFLRDDIIEVFKYLIKKKRSGECYKVYIYTSNIYSPEFPEYIKNYIDYRFETKLMNSSERSVEEDTFAVAFECKLLSLKQNVKKSIKKNNVIDQIIYTLKIKKNYIRDSPFLAEAFHFSSQATENGSSSTLRSKEFLKDPKNEFCENEIELKLRNLRNFSKRSVEEDPFFVPCEEKHNVKKIYYYQQSVDENNFSSQSTENTKTYENFIKCSQLPHSTIICFIDNTFYKKMKNKNVYYIYIKPYTHSLTKHQICERFIKAFNKDNLPLQSNVNGSFTTLRPEESLNFASTSLSQNLFLPKFFCGKNVKSKLLNNIIFFFENTK